MLFLYVYFLLSYFITNMNVNGSQILIFDYVRKVLQNSIYIKLCESTDSLLSDIYESLSVEEKMKINKKITPAILQSFYPEVDISLSMTSIPNIKQRIEVNPVKRCLARVGLGKQCSRSRKDKGDFCTGHSKSLPYGRIDGPLEGKALHVKKPRGRRTTVATKSKQVAHSKKGLNMSKYLQTTVVHFEKDEYLLDEYGIMYTNTAENSICGRVVDDTIQWFS